MLFSTAMNSSKMPSPARVPKIALTVVLIVVGLVACKRSEEPQPDYLKTQREAMERAKDVGKTMQKAVDQEGKKAEEEGK